MDGGHLGADDGIVLPHLFRKRHLLDGRGVQFPLLGRFLPDLDGREKGTDTDPGGPQIVHLVYFQAGVDLAGTGQDIVHLIRGDGIQPAAEGVQLYQVQVLHGLHIACGRVEPGMIHPLVRHDERPLRAAQMGDGILGEHGDVKGSDQLRDAVVDLRVYVVRPSRQHDAALSGLLQEGQGLFALFADGLPGVRQLLPGGFRGGLHAVGRQFRKFLQQGLRHGAQIPEGHEGIAQHRLAVADGLHIVLDVLGVGRDDGAVVMVVGPLHLVPLIKQRRVEDEIHLLPDQPLHMPMGQLGRITFGFAGDGLDSQFVDFARGGGGEHHTVPQPGEENMPEGIVLVHIQHPGNAHRASGSAVRRKGLVGEEALELVFK